MRGHGVTGPEHLREGKRLLGGTDVAADPEQGMGARHDPPSQMDVLTAIGHLLAALIAVEVEDKLPDRVSWQEAAES